MAADLPTLGRTPTIRSIVGIETPAFGRVVLAEDPVYGHLAHDARADVDARTTRARPRVSCSYESWKDCRKEIVLADIVAWISKRIR